MTVSRKRLLIPLMIVVLLIISLFAGCSSKECLYRKVNLGMSLNEVKNNETANLKGSYDTSGAYTKRLYYICFDDELANGNEVAFEYYFTSDDKLAKISVYYHGSQFTNDRFMLTTKARLDAKHGSSEVYSATYSGYFWDCDNYKIYLVYWEDGYVMLEYYAK